MSTPIITPLAAHPIPDRRRVNNHFGDVNMLLAELKRDRARHDLAQACYLMALMSIATRWTAPRGLLEYARDLCIEGGNVSREVIEQVRKVAVAYAKLRDVTAAIAEAESAQAQAPLAGGPA